MALLGFSRLQTRKQRNIAILFGCFSLAVLLHYPGDLNYDATEQWYEARHAVHFSQHQPAMALLWHFLDMVVPGPGLMVIVQLAAFWGAAALAASLYAPPPLAVLGFGAAVLAYPNLLVLSGQVQKDVFGGDAALLAIMLIAHAAAAARPRLWCALGFMAAACAIEVRAQFAIILPILCVFIALQEASAGAAKAAARALRLGGVGLAACLATALAIEGAVALTFVDAPDPTMTEPGRIGFNIGNTSNARQIRKVLLYDIAGTVANAPDAPLAVFDAAGVDTYSLRKQVATSYTTDAQDSLVGVGGVPWLTRDLPASVIRQQWLAVLLAKPGAMLHHKLATFGRVLGSGDPYKCSAVVIGLSPWPAELAGSLDAASYRTALSDLLAGSRYLPMRLFARPFPFAILNIIILCVFAAGGSRGFSVPPAAALLAGCGLAYELTFFILSQACQTRYSYFMMACAVFAAALAGFSRTPDANRANPVAG